MKVDFNTPIKDIEGKQIVEKAGVPEVMEALVKAGVARAQLDVALSGLQRYFGTEPETRKMTAATVACVTLQAVEAGASGAERVDRMRLVMKAIDPVQPVEITEKEKDMLLKSVEKTYANSALVYFRMHELLAGGGSVPPN